MRSLFKGFGAFVLVLTLASCEKDTGNLGLDLIHSQTFKLGALKEMPIVTTTGTFDSFISTNPGNFLLGAYDDPYFGHHEAFFSTQLALSKVSPKFGDSATVDSVFLMLPYNGYYGDTTQSFSVEVHRLGEIIELDSTYREDDVFATAELLNDSSFLPKPKVFTRWRGVSGSTPVMRLRLDPSVFQTEFFDAAAADSTIVKTSGDFFKHFKGLQVKGSSSNKALFALSPTATDGRVLVYYSNDTSTKALRFDLLMLDRVRYVNHFEHNYAQAAFDFSTQDTAVGSPLIYSQSMGGAAGVLRLESLKALRDSNLLVNYAEIVMHVEEGTVFDYRLPPALSLLAVRGNTRNLIADYVTGTAGGRLVTVGELRDRTYSFNVTRHVQRILNGKDSIVAPLLIVPESMAATPRRVVLTGNLHPVKPMQFNLYITRTK